MAYINDMDLALRVGGSGLVHLADDDGDGVADAAVLEEVRQAAEGVVNSFLARRFAVPIDLEAHPTVAGVIRAVTLDLAEFRLRIRRPPPPMETIRRRDQALSWLAGVAEGRVELPSQASLPSNDTLGRHGVVSGEPRLLNRSELADH